MLTSFTFPEKGVFKLLSGTSVCTPVGGTVSTPARR